MSDVFQPEQLVGGRYRVVRKLGGGGMADVYLCEDLTLGRHVAVKVLLQRYLNDPTFVERFRREAKAAAGLNQQNLVSIYDWGEVDGTYYIVMEYVEGETLKDLIRRRERLSGNESVNITMQLLAAVDFAHRSGIVHRDIKPQNVMIDRDGTCKVMDFGIARAGDSGMTEAGSILGTAQYLAPEQAKGYPVDERSDLYSVGVVLYEMLTGTVPFKGDSAVTVALKHVNEVPREPAELVPGTAVLAQPDRAQGDGQGPDRPVPVGGRVRPRPARRARGRCRCRPPRSTPAASARASWPPAWPAWPAARQRCRRRSSTSPCRRAARSPSGRSILVILLLAIIAAVAVGLWWTMSGAKDPVPSVVGLSKSAAVKAIEKAGFKAGVQEEFSDRVASGCVSRQAPTGGTKLREGATVDIWVSKGSELVTLRDFKGWTDAEVDDWLSQNDLVGDRHTRQEQLGGGGSGVQAGPAGEHGGQARRHGVVLDQHRQAAGDGAGSDRHDSGPGIGRPRGGRPEARHPDQ